MKKRITALLLLLTLSVTSLFACTSADKSESTSDKAAKTSKSTSTKKQELTPVTLNEVAHSIFYAPMYVAIEKGYFANEGIDLSLVTGFGVSQLVQDDFDLSYISLTAIPCSNPTGWNLHPDIVADHLTSPVRFSMYSVQQCHQLYVHALSAMFSLHSLFRIQRFHLLCHNYTPDYSISPGSVL